MASKTIAQTTKAPNQIYRTKEESQPAFRPRYDAQQDKVRDATKDINSLMSSDASKTRQEHDVSVGIARTMATDHIMSMDEEIKFINSQMKPGDDRNVAIKRLQQSIASTSGVSAGLSGDAAQAYDQMYVSNARKLATTAMTKWDSEQMEIDYSNLQNSFNNFLDVADGLDPIATRSMLGIWSQRLGNYTKGGDAKVFEQAAGHIVKGIQAEVLANPAASNEEMAQMLMGRNFMGLVETDDMGNISYTTGLTKVNSALAQAINSVIKPAYKSQRKSLAANINSGYKSEESRLSKLETMGRTLLKSKDPREQAEGKSMIQKSIEGKERIAEQYTKYNTASGSSYSGTTNPILGKRGGSRSWRNNNPGNISGTSLFRGAIGFHTQGGAKAAGDRSILVFPTMQAGWDAMKGMLDKNYSSGPIEKTFGKYQEASMSGKIRDVRKAGIDTKRSWGSLNDSEKQTLMQIWSQHEGFKEGSAFDSGVNSEGLMNVAASNIGTHKTTKGDYDQFVSEFRKQETFMLQEAKITGDYSKIETLLDDAAQAHMQYGVRNAKIFSSEKLNYKTKEHDRSQGEAKRLYNNKVKENKELFDSGTVDVAAAKQEIVNELKKTEEVNGAVAQDIRSDIVASKTAALVAMDPNMPNNLMNSNTPQDVKVLEGMRPSIQGDMKVKVDQYFATGYPSTAKFDEDKAIGADTLTNFDYMSLDARGATSSKRVAEARALSVMQTFNSALEGNKGARNTFNRKMLPGGMDKREITALVKFGTKGLATSGINGYIQRQNSTSAMMSIPKLEAEFINSIKDIEQLGDYLFYKQMAKTLGGKPMDPVEAKYIDNIKIGQLTPGQRTSLDEDTEFYAEAKKQIETIDSLPIHMRKGMQIMAQKLSISGNGAAIQPALQNAMLMFKPVNSSGDGANVQMTSKVESLLTRGAGAEKEIVMNLVASHVIEQHLISMEKFDNIEGNLDLIKDGRYTIYEEGGQHYVQVFVAGNTYFNTTAPFEPDLLSVGYTENTYIGKWGQEVTLPKKYGIKEEANGIK